MAAEKVRTRKMSSMKPELRAEKFILCGQEDGGSPRLAQNMRRRNREGPEPPFVQTPFELGWHTQGREGRINVLPRYRPVGLAKTSSEGMWSPRGTGTTVLTCPCPSQP